MEKSKHMHRADYRESWAWFAPICCILPETPPGAGCQLTCTEVRHENPETGAPMHERLLVRLPPMLIGDLLNYVATMSHSRHLEPRPCIAAADVQPRGGHVRMPVGNRNVVFSLREMRC